MKFTTVIGVFFLLLLAGGCKDKKLEAVKLEQKKKIAHLKQENADLRAEINGYKIADPLSEIDKLEGEIANNQLEQENTMKESEGFKTKEKSADESMEKYKINYPIRKDVK